ncbi:hypothetical protein U5A82_17415 [Sphingobium sp. CR2-8]|uniref:phage tail assembly chaperone n=1 Tax=Sphingobium sp. CR2-8 TaxID=1306534 RepID=UPI002DBF3709|nr:hypothetical protein [Sphingobium sp. CR2-8]MEC3912188.1 hypothetical protein [Sphingobium sp. CR2-8]
MGRRPRSRTDRRARGASGGKLTEGLQWTLSKHGAFIAARKKEEEDGSKIPDDLQPPDIEEGFEGWIDAFMDLGTERQIGMVEGPIPASAIARHTQGWHYVDAHLFEICMRQLDKIYLKRGSAETSEQPQASARDAFRAATANRRGG